MHQTFYPNNSCLTHYKAKLSLGFQPGKSIQTYKIRVFNKEVIKLSKEYKEGE